MLEELMTLFSTQQRIQQDRDVLSDSMTVVRIGDVDREIVTFPTLTNIAIQNISWEKVICGKYLVGSEQVVDGRKVSEEDISGKLVSDKVVSNKEFGDHKVNNEEISEGDNMIQ